MQYLNYPYPSLKQWIAKRLEESKPNGKYYYSLYNESDYPDLGETWAIVDEKPHESMGLFYQSNWEVIKQDMCKNFPRQTDLDGRWLMVQLLRVDGKPTKAAEAIYGWAVKLSDYPVASDDHYSELTMNEQIDSISQSCRYAGIDNYNVWDIVHWLDENCSSVFEDVDDNGYIDEISVYAACYALGYMTDDQIYDFTSTLVRETCRYNGTFTEWQKNRWKY